jgi:hypothetical protein
VRAATALNANPDTDADTDVNQSDPDPDRHQPDPDPDGHQPDADPVSDRYEPDADPDRHDPDPDADRHESDPGHHRSDPQPIGLRIGKRESQRKLRDLYRYANRAYHQDSAEHAGQSLRRRPAHACEHQARAGRAVDRESVDAGR